MKISEHFHGKGIVLICDQQGKVNDVVCNYLCEVMHIQSGDSFFSTLDSESVQKGKAFFEAVLKDKVAMKWELNICTPDTPRLMTFHGSCYHESVVIMGSFSSEELALFIEEQMKIQNQQTNQLRALMKDHVDFIKKQASREKAYLEDFTVLNNELTNVQRELIKKNAQLRELNNQKNMFLGIAAHDLRTPLNAIMGFSEFLVEDLDEVMNDDQKDILTTIFDSSRYMLNLVNDLLDYSKIEMGKLDLHLKKKDIRETVGRTISLNRPLAEKNGIQIHYEDCEERCDAVVDNAKITQVMNNLLINAIRYSPRDTSIKVSIQIKDGFFWISVQDQGYGIPEEEQGKLFKPFGTTSVTSTHQEKSSGLGLAIVKKIVEGHGGKITLQSQVGKGSTFAFSIPMV